MNIDGEKSSNLHRFAASVFRCECLGVAAYDVMTLRDDVTRHDVAVLLRDHVLLVVVVVTSDGGDVNLAGGEAIRNSCN